MRMLVSLLTLIFFTPINTDLFFDEPIKTIRLDAVYVAYAIGDDDWNDWQESSAIILIREYSGRVSISIYAGEKMHYSIYSTDDYIDDDGDIVFVFDTISDKENRHIRFRLIVFNDSDLVQFYVNDGSLNVVYIIGDIR